MREELNSLKRRVCGCVHRGRWQEIMASQEHCEPAGVLSDEMKKDGGKC